MTPLRTLPQLSGNPSDVKGLAKAFRPPSEFAPKITYCLLPFRFLRYDDERYFLTNLVGEYLLLGVADFRAFAGGTLSSQSPSYIALKAKHFLYDDVSDVALELLATKYRTKQSALKNFTALHLFVVTLRCDHSCPYCQVSRVSEDRGAFDMTEETASRSIELMFKSPSPMLKVEFQGGESLLNFGLIRYIVHEVKRRNDGRQIDFVIATNLSQLTDDILVFCQEHSIFISTSLDGPAELHNANRPRPGRDSFERAISGIARVRNELGVDSVSALMTTTALSLEMPHAIIDEYLRQGFRSIFLRSISPYGFAVKSMPRIGYAADAFLKFYQEGLNYILDLNAQGVAFREEFAAIILKKALSPWATGYVDLQSPSGLGISVIVYNYNGDVYASDEARMLAEHGDHGFRLGNVHKDSYRDLFVESDLLPLLHETMTEGMPGCTDCAYQPWCGTDPVFHHATQGDAIGHRPTSEFCKKHMGIFRTLVDILEGEPEPARILRSWMH